MLWVGEDGRLGPIEFVQRSAALAQALVEATRGDLDADAVNVEI
jgi:hypothetical protein